jgi:ribulose-5-phosphate 4-epimerase/fuculose-1-phosphate aldolase
VNEPRLREAIVVHGRSLYERGYAHGRTGNLSIRLDDTILITPTGSCLGRLDPSTISKVAADGSLISGDPPSKESFLHLAMYSARLPARSIVHLHCKCAVALSCLVHKDESAVLPALTPYQMMRVGSLPLVPYARPGDPKLAEAVRHLAGSHRSLLLSNHGPVVSGSSIDDAVDSAEELEATAALALLLEGRPVRTLTRDQVAELEAFFPN